MKWPGNNDYCEALQNPQDAFDDAELRAGQPQTGPMGLPHPCAGNFADVYKMSCESGNTWAVKCFTRYRPGLQQSYQAISAHLKSARLPMTVDFHYLEKGIRIHDDWFPVLKMRWVEGLTLNEYVKRSLATPKALMHLAALWVRVAKSLHGAELAHGDLQHGNVLLVQGKAKLLLRLIDYDGMYVPALRGSKAGEVGHPSYQHPQRARDGTFNVGVDRFSHLVIYCALRSLARHGAALWEKFDNGDNLLFTEADLKTPAESKLFHELLDDEDAAVRALAGQLLLALDTTVDRLPNLDDIVADGRIPALTADQNRRVDDLLRGVSAPSGKNLVVQQNTTDIKIEVPADMVFDEAPIEDQAPAAPSDWFDSAPSSKSDAGATVRRVPMGLAAGIAAAVIAACGAAVYFFRSNDTGTTAPVPPPPTGAEQRPPPTGPTAGVGAGATVTENTEPPATVETPVGKADPGSGDWRPLFNGRDLTGWREMIFGAAGSAPVYSSTVVDGSPAIRVSGRQLAVLETAQDFENYHFQAEFKWGVGAPMWNSGIFYHAQGLRRLQFEIEPRREGGRGVGGFWSDGSVRVDYGKPADGGIAAVGEAPPHIAVTDDAERPHGEWNRIELVCLNDAVLHVVNGRVVLVLAGARDESAGGPGVPRRRGRIQLESSEGEIFFRNLRVRPIAALPTEFRGTQPVATVESDKQRAEFNRLVERAAQQIAAEKFDDAVASYTAALKVIPGDQTALAARAEAERIRSVRLSPRRLHGFTGHADSVLCAALTADGGFLLTGGADRLAIIWNLTTGREEHRLPHSASVTGLCVSADGQRALSASDKTVRVWDLAPRTQVGTLDGHTDTVHCVAVSPDGKRAATGSADRTVRIWDVAAGKSTATLNGHTASVRAVAFSPDGTRLLSGSTDGTVRLWRLESGTHTQLSGHMSGVYSVAFTPDGRSAVSAGFDRSIRLWDVASGKETRKLEGHTSAAPAVGCAGEPARVVTGGLDGTVRLWNLNGGLLYSITVPAGVRSLAVASDGGSVAYGTVDGQVAVWRLPPGTTPWVEPDTRPKPPGTSAESSPPPVVVTDQFHPSGLPAGVQPVTDWAVIGPFAAVGGEDLTSQHPPDRETDFTKTYPGKSGPVRWQRLNAAGGTFPLQLTFGRADQSLFYAVAYVECPAAVDAIMGIGSDDSCRVWVNDAQVGEVIIQRPLSPNQDRFRVRFRGGRNVVRLKLAQGGATYGLAMHLSGVDGRAIPGLRVVVPDLSAAPGTDRGSAGTIDENEYSGPWQQLFNGRDLAGWQAILSRPGNPADFFSVAADGSLRAVGNNTPAFLATAQEFADFHLRFEFKRAPGRFNSGVFYHVNGRRGTFPPGSWQSLHCEMSDDLTGKLWTVDAVADVEGIPGLDGPIYRKGARLLVGVGPMSVLNPPANFENVPGEWNTVEVVTFGGTSIHMVNGKVAIVAKNTRIRNGPFEAPLTRGRIQIEAFVGEAHFRKIELRPLRVFPKRLLEDAPTVPIMPPGGTEPGRRLEGHTGIVYGVAFSPDGKQAVTGSADQTVRVWNVATGTEVRRWDVPGATIRAVAFSPDGTQVLTGGYDRTVRLWNAASGTEIRRFEGPTGNVHSVAFSPDGKRVLAGGSDRIARVWNTATGTELRRFEGHTSTVFSVAFSPDGKQVATGSLDRTVRLWNAATGAELRRLEGHSSTVYSVAFSPDGRQVVTGSLDRSVRLWNAAVGTEVRRFDGHTGYVNSVAFSPNGRFVVTGAIDRTARLWNVDTGQEIRRFDGHTATVYSVAISPDGKHVLSGSTDRTARLWNVEPGP